MYICPNLAFECQSQNTYMMLVMARKEGFGRTMVIEEFVSKLNLVKDWGRGRERKN